MSIKAKIETIRKKPDHIKLRYIWACVAVSMFVIFTIWIVYITALLQKDKGQPAPNQTSIDDIKTQLQNIKEQGSVNSLQSQPAENEGVTKGKNSADFQYPLKDDVSGEQAPANYSDIPSTNSTQQ